MAYTSISLAGYLSLIEVMNLVDCGVRQDIDCGEDVRSKCRDLFWLGDEPDLSSGLPGLCASPPFHTLADLDAFCAANLTQYDAAVSEMERSNACHEAWFWESQLDVQS